MGLFGAMTASVSGLAAQGEAISVISDNLANTNTVGYKASRALFSQLVTTSGVGGTAYNAGGLETSVKRDQGTQGSLTSTSSVTDLAISGNGFFRVADSETTSTSTQYLYTRAGSFTENKAGFLVTSNGFYLQGWRTDAAGNIANLQNLVNIELQSVGVSASATTEVDLGVNLNSSQEPLDALYDTTGALSGSLSDILDSSNNGIYLTDARIYDSQGTARDVTFAFSKRSANQWDWQFYTDGSNIQGGTPGAETVMGSGTLEFNPSGTLKYASNTSVTANWSGGVLASDLNLNFGDFSGGKIVSAVSDGLDFQDTTVPAVTANNTVPAAEIDVSDAAPAMTPGTYYMVVTGANQVVLSTDAAGTLGVIGPVAAVDGAQTLTFPNGVTVETDATFDADSGAYPDNQGDFTVGTTGAGNVLAISIEDNAFVAGTYTVRKTSASTVGLYDAAGTLVDTANVSATGTREIYFPTSDVRMTVSENFDETAGTYPSTVGTFTVTDQAALSQGLANNGVIQFASDFNTSFINQDGFASGTLSAIQIDENGFVAGTFTNGETKRLYKVALAVFQNPRGLEAVSGSLLRVTDTSGQALIKEPGLAGTGRLVSGALEASTTDIASEFSQMIVSQRAFQANSTVITTVDQMLQNLLQLR